jgi:hypothetical protein
MLKTSRPSTRLLTSRDGLGTFIPANSVNPNSTTYAANIGAGLNNYLDGIYPMGWGDNEGWVPPEDPDAVDWYYIDDNNGTQIYLSDIGATSDENTLVFAKIISGGTLSNYHLAAILART